MANIQIGQLTNKAAPASTDEIEIQETSLGSSFKATLLAIFNALSNYRLLAYQYTQALATTGITTEETLFTYTLPGGKMGANGKLRIPWVTSRNTAGAESYVLRLYLGATIIQTYTWTSNRAIQSLCEISNRNSQSAQITFPGAASGGVAPYGTSGAAPATYTVDTSVDQIIKFTIQRGAADAIAVALESISVELIKP